MASRTKDTEKPSRNRLLEKVRAYKELKRKTALEELLAKILAEIKQTASRKDKRELRTMEREIVDRLYLHNSLARVVYDLRKSPGKKGRPRRDDVRVAVLQLRSEGKSWPQIRQRMNGKTGKDLTVNAYRNLVQRKP